MIIDGKSIAENIQNDIKSNISKNKGRVPCLAMVLVGDNPSSKIYIKRKNQGCELVGIHSINKEFLSNITETQLLHEITLLNNDPEIDGILVQLPLPIHINSINIINMINPDKDIDGFHPLNVGKLLIGETDGFFPCTPLGIQTLLAKSSIQVDGKNVLVIGRSNIVGKPIAALLMQNSDTGNATVTVANRHTTDLKSLCKKSDIIIAAVGHPKFITSDMISEGVVIIDVGINQIEDLSRKSKYKIVGDVDFENVQHKCSHITPVPGGVGPMTIAMLLQNTLKSYSKSLNKNV